MEAVTEVVSKALRNRDLFYNPIEVYPDQEVW